MTFAQLKRVSKAFAGVFSILAIGGLCWLIVTPLADYEGPSDLEVAASPYKKLSDLPSVSSSSAQGDQIAGSQGRFATTLAKRLQRPVIESAPHAVVVELQAPLTQPPQLPIELLATAIDAGGAELSRAWVRINGTEEKMVRVGDKIESISPVSVVKAIEAKHIVLNVNGFDLEYRFE